jgi:exodeoxyribonuclease-3
MRMVSWNVNGIRAILKKGLLDFIEKDGMDVLCIQETKAHPDQLTKKVLDHGDYHKFFSSAEKKGYSGVTTWSLREPDEVEYGLGVDRFDSEGRTLITHFGDSVLFNIYFPNGKKNSERLRYKLDFYETFQEKAENYKNSGKHVVVCGDVNTAHMDIDLARPRENETTSGFLPVEREWIDGFLSAGFIDTFREFNQDGDNYSWWDYKTRARERNIGWRIDYFYIDEDSRNRLKDAFILKEVMGSDHCPVGIELSI